MREVYIDVETTGLGYTDEVIEVAVLDTRGEILLNTLIAPVRQHDDIAEEIHGITREDLKNAPTFHSIAERLHEILEGSIVVAHNVAFDLDMLNNEFQLAGAPTPTVRPHCTMLATMEYLQSKRWISLRDSMASLGQFYDIRRGHRAAYDAECARAIKSALLSLKA